MRTCVLCEMEKEDVSSVQVVPATWTGFHSYVDICAGCRETERYQKMVKQRRIVVSQPAAAKSGAAAAAPAPEPPARGGARSLEIAHRKTGAVLQTVEGGTLAQAVLAGAALSGADLRDANLTGADLHKADLRLADLAGADLRRSDLREANLRGADLRGADLRDARLNRADLSHALYDDTTLWPAGFDRQVSGAQHERR